MTMTLILLLLAQTAVRVSTLQRGRHHAATVRQDTLMQTATHQRSVWPAVWVVMQQQGARHVVTARLVHMTMIWTRQVRV